MTNETQPQEYTDIVELLNFDERHLKEGFANELCKDSDGDLYCTITIPKDDGNLNCEDDYIEKIRSIVGDERHIEETYTLDDAGKDTMITFTIYLMGDIDVVKEDFFGWCEEGGFKFCRTSTDVIVDWAIENLGKGFRYSEAIIDWRECDEETAFGWFGVRGDDKWNDLATIVYDLQQTDYGWILFRVTNSNTDYPRK